MHNGSKTCYYSQKTLYLFILFIKHPGIICINHIWGLIQHT